MRMSSPVIGKRLPSPRYRVAEALVKYSGSCGKLIESWGPRSILPISPDLAGGNVVERDQDNVTRQCEL